MKASLTITSVLLASVAAGNTAWGQAVATPTAVSPVVGFGWDDLGYGYHASTFEEGVLRGRAALAQSLGQANYYHSLAAVNYQDATTKAIKNHQQAIDAYFYNQQANRSAREAKRSPRLTQEQYVALARADAPDRLSDREYDRTFGRLEWPAVLSSDEFATEREELDRVFGSRTMSSAGAGSAFYGEVRELTTKLQEKLRSRLETLDPAQYMAAKNYLLSLNYEARQPVVTRNLASR